MKIGDLNMKCGECELIDYCNDYEYTPPCSQERFDDIDTEVFVQLAETSKYGDKNEIIEDVFNRLGTI